MKLASLFSGGKDSTYAIYKAKQEGHSIACLVSAFPESEESYLLHFPDISLTSLQARAMGIPHIATRINTADPETEITELQNLIAKAKEDFQIDGILHGGLFSNYQKIRFEAIAKNLDLKMVSPLWHIDQKVYFQELLQSKFKIIITSVACAGLDEKWLGREITMDVLEQLMVLSSKHGFNLTFEGGEAETFVINCPLFHSEIKIINANKIWDGYRGRFEITEAILEK